MNNIDNNNNNNNNNNNEEELINEMDPTGCF